MDGDPGGIIKIAVLLLLFLVVVCVNGAGAAIHALGREDFFDEDEGNIVLTLIAFILGAFFVKDFTAWLLVSMPEGLKRFLHAAFLQEGVAVALSLFLYLIVLQVLGVQIPKLLATKNPEKWLRRWSGGYRILLAFAISIRAFTGSLSKGILRLFGVKTDGLEDAVTEEEIRSIVHEGHEQGVIQQTEAEMISNIFEFSEKEAGDIMTHRNDVLMIDGTMSLNDAVRYMLTERNSRFPVYEDNIDNIIGVVHLRDAVRFREEHKDLSDTPIRELSGVMRDALFVPETKNIDDLFRLMQKSKSQMVVVIDEYGQTAGIVAMEDILEEIVGNIMDEYDIDENHITATGNKNEFMLEGRTPLEDLEKKFQLHFEDDRFETLNGFMMSHMDRVPRPNDHFVMEYQGYRFRVLSVADRQIQRVLMTKI